MARVLLYDADCGFCTASARRLARWRCEVDLVPYQTWPGLAARGITPAAAAGAVHLVDGDRVRIGHEAIAGALRRSRLLPVRLAGRVVDARVLRPVAKAAYAWLAANRHRLPGATEACAVSAPSR